MRKLYLSFLIVLSIYNYSVKENYKNIPVITIISSIENNEMTYDEDVLTQVIYKDVAEYYKKISKRKINLYKPIAVDVNKVQLDEEFHYENRKTYGLKSIIKSQEVIDYKKFDVNNNQKIESDELIIINILETKDTYDQPIASTIKTKDFYIENLKIGSYIQLGVTEVFTNRESLLTASTVAHEIGHYFGLPDLYDTDYSSKGLGPMSLMSEIHSDHPINFDPWSKLTLGINEAYVIKKSGIHEIEKEKIYLIETNKDWIYYLIESRSFEGYDESLGKVMSSDGIFIYKINEKVISETIESNHVNRDEENMGVKFLGNKVSDKAQGIYLDAINSNNLSIEIRNSN